MHARLRGPSNLLILHLLIEPDFSCLADELAEQRPDMNIKVTAFTVSEKSIVTYRVYHLHTFTLWRHIENAGILNSVGEVRITLKYQIHCCNKDNKEILSQDTRTCPNEIIRIK